LETRLGTGASEPHGQMMMMMMSHPRTDPCAPSAMLGTMSSSLARTGQRSMRFPGTGPSSRSYKWTQTRNLSECALWRKGKAAALLCSPARARWSARCTSVRAQSRAQLECGVPPGLSDPATASAARHRQTPHAWRMVLRIFSTVNGSILQEVLHPFYLLYYDKSIVFLFRNLCFSINPPIWCHKFDHAKIWLGCFQCS
jgi:hypothetical protein